jgi:hypothetical protein
VGFVQGHSTNGRATPCGLATDRIQATRNETVVPNENRVAPAREDANENSTIIEDQIR